MPRSAAAALLLLRLQTALGVPDTRVSRDSSVGRMLRGPSDVSIVEADRSVNREIAAGRGPLPAARTEGTGGFGNLPLLRKCYMTDDCAPGLFAEAGLRTQCNTTPFSSSDAVCCKPFATPCDSNEACCSGNCNTRHTRCDDAISYLSSDYEQRTAESELGGTEYNDIEDGDDSGYDDSGYDDVDQYDDVRHDDDVGQHGDIGQLKKSGHSDDHVHYDDSQYDDDQYDDRQYHDGQPNGGQKNDGEPNDDGQSPLDPAASAGPLDYSDPGDEVFDGPPMKIDPDGPHAHGRSYSNFEDDFYDGYARGAGGQDNRGGGMSWEERVRSRRPDSRSQPSGTPGGDTSAPSPAPLAQRRGVGASADGDSRGTSAEYGCVLNYSSGTIETIASSSEERIETVAMDSQGNVFYALSLGHGNNGDTIRRAASSRSLSPDGGAAENLPQGEDVLLYTGTGSILAMTVDADDDLVFTMVDVPAVSGGVYTLRMAPGGVVRPRDQLPEGEGGRGQGDGTGGGSDGGRGGGGGDAAAPAVALAAHLGPFLPGVAVCPVTGDVYATKGHTGITRLVKGADGGFGRKVEWNMKDMPFNDLGKTRAPLMVWDIAVNSIGIVYFTTYVQGVVLKGIFPRGGGDPEVRLAAGSWDSGVSASSGDGGKAVSAELAYPKGLAVGADDSIYVAEFQGGRVRRVSTSGIISTVVGTGSTAYEGDGGPASEAGLDLPNAIAFSPTEAGSVMAIADFGHSAVRAVTPARPCF